MQAVPQRDSVRPRVDSRPLYDIIAGAIGYPAVFVAYELKLFPLLADRPRTLSEVAEVLHIEARPAEAILLANVALKLLRREGECYALTAIAEDYLLENSPTYFGALFDLVIHNKFATSIESLKQAVLTNRPQSYGGDDVFKSHQEKISEAKAFTRGMHSLSVASAQVWPGLVDLSEHRTLLDLGGGSGAHTIGAIRRWPGIKGIIFDIEPVCEVAKEFIHKESLEERLQTCVGDLWNSPYPDADVHFYSQIYHDWSLQKCELLTRKSFDSLPSDGQIILHEILFDDDKAGPFIAAASSCAMLLWTEGKQFSGAELAELLTKVGFVDVMVKPSHAYWSIVSARKP